VGRIQNFCSYAKSFTRQQSQNHPGSLKDSLKKPLVEGNLASQLTGL
jgi:hypothetical protein